MNDLRYEFEELIDEYLESNLDESDMDYDISSTRAARKVNQRHLEEVVSILKDVQSGHLTIDQALRDAEVELCKSM